MRLGPLAIFCVACLAMAGCQPGRSTLANAELERENRELEDQLYQLKWELDSCRQQNESLRGPAGGASPAPSASAGPAFPSPGGSSPSAPMQPTPAAPPVSPGELRPPSIELPNEAAPSGPPASSTPVPRGSKPSLEDAPRFQAPGPAGPPSAAVPARVAPRLGAQQILVQGDSRQVARITLGPRSTGGRDIDGRPGDDGIGVVIEPRDAQERLVLAPAAVSVVVLDPALSGEAARLARWDFSADDITAACRHTVPGEGVHLEMTWPGRPPAHGQLHVFVRYTTSDGRKLEADKAIDVRLAGEPGRAWSPANPISSARPSADRSAQWQAKPAPEPRAASEVAEPVHTAGNPNRPVWSPQRR